MTRLDQALMEHGLCESRERAKRAILAGQVRVNGQTAHKASDSVRPGDQLTIDTPEKFVSRGGHKLEYALMHFGIVVKDLLAIDLGASTGGFTDCLLQHGAARVHAVDVGQGQLAWKLRRDPRVVVMEKTNARHLAPDHMPAGFAPADLAVIDCSFISLKKILPPAIALLKPEGKIMALIKPQFDKAIHERVLAELAAFVAELPQCRWVGVTESPLLGPAGNKEFLVLIEKTN